MTDGRSLSQSVCLGIEHPCETCDQILLPVGMLVSEISGLVSVGRRLWREDGSAVCSAITQWSESLRTRNHTLLSHLRLLQPGWPGSRIYIPQEQSGLVIPPGPRWSEVRLLYDWRSVSQSVCLGIEHACGSCDQILLPVGMLLSEISGLVSVGRPLWREDGSAICSAVTHWSESSRIRNHTLLSHLRLPPTWRARFPYLYPPGTGWTSYTPEHWVLEINIIYLFRRYDMKLQRS
jgi:hypothetical protein